jgi:hypothetical protein
LAWLIIVGLQQTFRGVFLNTLGGILATLVCESKRIHLIAVRKSIWNALW